MKEVVVCAYGPSCHGDHHGWDCPLSDPVGDVLRAWTHHGPPANPILAASYQKTLERWLNP